MLDARIYRTGLVVVALFVVVLAFSLQNQPGALSSSLAPDAFNGQNVYANMTSIAARDPIRSAGSVGDYSLAAELAASFRQYRSFTVSTDTFTGSTAGGIRTLENVVAVRPGLKTGSVVIVAHRDARGSPALASLSGSATLVELARDLEGETLNRTVVLASTSGSQGTAGAIRLAATLGGPVDAVIVLGDLASAHPRQPIVVPWSTSPAVAPPMLRNTLTAEIAAQASLSVGGTGLAGQFAHLAFPLTVSEQGPFGGRGIPAVLLSLSGERSPAADAPVAGPGQLGSVGRAVLATVSALDSGPTLPPASAYALFDAKVVPAWAISLFVLALIVPVLLTTIDGLARARRRQHPVARWLVLVLAVSVPFVLGALVVMVARLTGVIGPAPPGPVGAGAIPLRAGGIAALVVAAVLALGLLALIRRLAQALGTRERGSAPAAPALLVVMLAVTVAIWISNPFAALLLVPALHLWLPAIDADLRIRLPVRLTLVLAGLVPAALVVLYYADTLGFGASGSVWTAMLLIAGGGVTLLAVLEWSVVLGCVVSAVAISALASRAPRAESAPVTVRGPVTYAGPGSLGGTESALRR